ncbi:MAG: aminodeoxychorismate synthase component I [Halomonas sp.]|nr:aminodeoxychorismate synthase component I [Halomonas sp.]MDN6297300.1 aminodeoxychorismate synthase component I [Halomonas sp.]MDN6314345.1 aminodeoxychorismate synthase component I [Halomonas sp.]MDN6336131.1 aminodeoxychorismate synthase component I [Halomonas sp.]
MSPPLTLTALPYTRDPLALFARLRRRHGAVLLDSGRPAATGRYDIIASDPLATLEVDNQGRAYIERHGDALAAPPTGLDDAFAAQAWLLEQLPVPSTPSELPFCGGLMGYWGYDVGRQRQGVLSHKPAATRLPAARLGLYDWAIILDHECLEAWLAATPRRAGQVIQWLEQAAPASAPFQLTAPFRAEMSQAKYAERFARVQRYIRAGDCYQINLAQRLTARYQGDEWDAYCRLRRATPTPFAGFMAWDDKAVMSLSPERFLQVSEGRVETRPIKGTRRRGDTPDTDHVQAQTLLQSAKDRAENVMIVDLLRNDLGRVCRPHSVRVPTLCGLESYPNVHHLVSVVQGELDASCSPLSLLEAAFPGGSITGAPKIRAMQIIDELEPCQRSLYCGSLGYVDVRGRMDTSIAIRTVLVDSGSLHVWGGGGLVADSSPADEYAETLDKIRHLVRALE